MSVTNSDKAGKDQKNSNTKFKAFNFERKSYQKYSMPLCHFDSFNLWLLKPTHLNRGRGIHVFRDLETLSKLIKQYCSGKELENFKKKESVNNQNIVNAVGDESQQIINVDDVA